MMITAHPAFSVDRLPHSSLDWVTDWAGCVKSVRLALSRGREAGRIKAPATEGRVVRPHPASTGVCQSCE